MRFSSPALPLARCIMRSLLSADTCAQCAVWLMMGTVREMQDAQNYIFRMRRAHSTRNGWLQVEKPLCDCLSANASMCMCVWMPCTQQPPSNRVYLPQKWNRENSFYSTKCRRLQTHTQTHDGDAMFAYIDCESIVLCANLTPNKWHRDAWKDFGRNSIDGGWYTAHVRMAVISRRRLVPAGQLSSGLKWRSKQAVEN